MALRSVVPTVVAEDAESLAEYASISIAFETSHRLAVDSAALLDADGCFEPRLTETLPETIIKDYDAHPANHPLDWPTRFSVERWTFLAAYRSGVRVGGAVIIADDSNIELLDSPRDLALLWDLRVAREFRGRGIGSTLLQVAKAWAWANGFVRMRVETQDINVAACRLYARNGFRLESVNPGAYADLPHEVQLILSVSLAGLPD